VKVIGVQVGTERLSRRKRTTRIVVTFSGAVDGASGLWNYILAAPGRRRRRRAVTYSKPIRIRSVTYDPAAHRVTLVLKRKLAKTQPPQLRITSAGILDAARRPLDGNGDGRPGGDYVALLTRRGAQPLFTRGIEAFVRRPPRFPGRR
jgi:hypothetical protein